MDDILLYVLSKFYILSSSKIQPLQLWVASQVESFGCAVLFKLYHYSELYYISIVICIYTAFSITISISISFSMSLYSYIQLWLYFCVHLLLYLLFP